MSINKVALIGSTGNVGPAVRNALLDANFQVTVLSREGSTATDSLASHPNQRIVKVDFNNVNSIASGLQGSEGVVSNVGGNALLSQKTIIDAAISAGVKRFLPSDFGADLSVKANAELSFNAPKFEIHRYLEQQAKAHPDFSYTYVSNGPFLDFCLRTGFFGNLKTHEMTLWDGGEVRVSTTSLPAVGKAVVGVFKNLDATKNEGICISETTVSQKEIMEIAKEIDGKEWTTKPGNTADALKIGTDELKKSEPDMTVAVLNQLIRLVFGAEHVPDMEHKLDNDKVGLPKLTREQLKELIKSFMS